MIVGDFYVQSVSLLPSKADSPLIVDSNAMLSAPIASKHLESVPRRDSEVIEVAGPMQHNELSVRHGLNQTR